MKQNGYFPSDGVIDKVLQVLLRKFGFDIEDLTKPTPVGLWESAQEDWRRLTKKQ